ncbi:MAG: endonuclease/exonuclease/phosphatase family protein [Pseudomonadota bacterium]
MARLVHLLPLALACLLAACTGNAREPDASGAGCPLPDLDGPLTKPAGSVRFATFNVYLNRSEEGALLRDLTSADATADTKSHRQLRAVAEIIQRVRPDVLLLNEFDHDEAGAAIAVFQRKFLGAVQNGQQPIDYPYRFSGPVNTGVPSGVDLDGDGRLGGPGDLLGFGAFPGQYGMVLLSRYPILKDKARTFQRFLWQDMPGALLPDNPATPAPGDYFSAAALAVFRLSSKSHWDLPIDLGEHIVHVLAAHPTPPVFDGPEDRNGRRNFDEIRFWSDYIGAPEDNRYHVDDAGRRGGLGRQPFVIMGDYNADPFDGSGRTSAIGQLLTNPAVNASVTPGSTGGAEDAAREGRANETHRSDPALDTADFNPASPGNLRVDYVLPSVHGLHPVCGGVFWPSAEDATRALVGDGQPVASSDHRLVWMDLLPR